MAKTKGRPLDVNKITVNKYKKEFISYMQNIHGSNAEDHFEDSNISQFPQNDRYTKEFLDYSMKKVEISFGNTSVKKYKPEFINFLKSTYGEEKYLEYIENKNIETITKVFPRETRYSEEYCNHRSKNTLNVKKFRRNAADNETRLFNEIQSSLADLIENGKEKLSKNNVNYFPIKYVY